MITHKFCAVMQFSFGIHLLMALTYFMLKIEQNIRSIERKYEKWVMILLTFR